MRSSQIVLFALVLTWSFLAAKSSRIIEIVSFIGEDKEILCNGSNAKWFFLNSTEINGNSQKYQITSTDDESILTIKKVDSMSAGVFKCLAYINDTFAQKIFNLRNYYALTMNNLSRNTVVAKEGDSVALKCKPYGIPSPQIFWFFEDEKLTPGKDYSRTNEGILINNIQVEQTGTYSCIGVQEFDGLKNVQEREIELIVEYGPSEVSAELITVYANINEIAYLNCSVQSNPIATFSWLRNNYEIFRNVEIRDSSTALQVKIENEESYKDTFSCIAKNDHGQSIRTFVLKERPQTMSDDARKTSRISMFLIISLMIFLNLF